MKLLLWILFAILAIGVGLYPVAYTFLSMDQGLLDSKSDSLLTNPAWNLFFYLHIYFGGITLLSGLTQFMKKLRSRRLQLHRILGKVYVLSVIISGIAGLYIAFYATGGIVASLGFGALAVFWLATTLTAYFYIRRKQIEIHRNWMLRSYALAFAAVTLRIYLPSFTMGLNWDFIPSYQAISWLCWVPNLIVAEIIIRRIWGTPTSSTAKISSLTR